MIRTGIGSFLLSLCAALCAGLGGGCAALTNPVAVGIPVRKLPPELLAAPRGSDQPVPLTALQQPPAGIYHVGPGDVLGVQIDGILGDKTLPVPVHVAPPVQRRDERSLDASSGYPVTVQADGTITLPFLAPLKVAGLSLAEVVTAIQRAYEDANRLRADLDRVQVALVRPRAVKVLVFRQEAAAFLPGQIDLEPSSKRGTGQLVDLLPDESDVLHALAQSGGLPGLDAYNQILIYRNCFADGGAGSAVLGQLQAGLGLAATPLTQPVVRIPLRLPPGVPAPFRAEDVTLHTGDVVFIEGRTQEVFYTAGLLPPGTHVLPRDYDLDVVRAIAHVRGPLLNGAFGGSNLSGTLIADGIGNPSPSLLVVLRRTPNGGQVPIVVDLQKAVLDPRERLILQAGDLLVLQEKPEDALARYFSQTFFNFGFIWQPIRGNNVAGIVDLATFNRLQNGGTNININQP